MRDLFGMRLTDRGPPRLVAVEVTVLGATSLALRVSREGGEAGAAWLPRAACDPGGQWPAVGERLTLRVVERLALEKGLMG